MSEEIKITVTKHTFLDCSVGWFVKINGVKSGGEITTEQEAKNIARSLAERMNAIYEEGIRESDEVLDALFGFD